MTPQTAIDLAGLYVLQAKMRKRLMYGGIVFVWILTPAYEITVGVLSTDIIKGTCMPWIAISSYAASKTMVFSIFFFAYLLPLMAMIFFYYRIVRTIRRKVTPVL